MKKLLICALLATLLLMGCSKVKAPTSPTGNEQVQTIAPSPSPETKQPTGGDLENLTKKLEKAQSDAEKAAILAEIDKILKAAEANSPVTSKTKTEVIPKTQAPAKAN